MIKWELVKVTPELAAKWLGKNDINRKLREHRCAFIARSIDDGKWITTHQGIAFSKSGRLLDGQHRLRAQRTNGSENDVFSRAWYALEPKNAEMNRIVLKDFSGPLTEARSAFRHLSEDVFDEAA